MGLLFALLGGRGLTLSSMVKFGVTCGAFPTGVLFLSVAGWTDRWDFNLIEYFLLGLPVALVLLSRFFPDLTELKSR